MKCDDWAWALAWIGVAWAIAWARVNRIRAEIAAKRSEE